MQPLLLLHGAIGAKDQLNPLAAQLKNNFDIHLLNFSGHGGAPMPLSFTIQKFATDVLDYLSENNIQKISVFGYSMGGYVALYLAKYHPDKIEKVFTLATKFEWTPDIAQKEIKMLDASKIKEKLPAFAVSLTNRHLPNDWEIVLKKTADLMTDLGNNNQLHDDDFKNIRIPVTISVGDSDNMVTLTESENVYKHLADARFLILPNTGHPIEKVDLTKLCVELIHFFNK